MKHLHLTINPECLAGIYDYLDDTDRLHEFFNRIGAITFHDYCTFYFLPASLATIGAFMEEFEPDYHKQFLQLLDGENVEDISVAGAGGVFFKYISFGGLQRMDDIEGISSFVTHENYAFIDFSEKQARYSFQTILEEAGKIKSVHEWDVLPTYASFQEWSLALLPREFDHALAAKHRADGGRGYGSPLLSNMEEVLALLPLAFYKTGDHEDWLFFYHLPKENTPILFFKSSRDFLFHGYHISSDEAQKKGVNVDGLKTFSKYALTQISLPLK